MNRIQQTSLLAYKQAQCSRGQRYRQICELLACRGDMSNKEISDFTSLPINCITPRVLELREMGIVKHRGYKQGNSGMRVNVWGL